MPSEFDNTAQLVEGADPTATWGAYATLLLQMIRQATPASLYGFIIESEETPPVTGSDAWRKRCLWKRISTQNLYYYNNTAGSWDNIEDLLPNLGVPDDASVTLAKIAATGAARAVLRIDTGGVALEFVSPVDIFNSGEIPISKITGSGGLGAGYILFSASDGTWTLANFTVKLDAALPSATIPSDRIFDIAADGVTGQVFAKASGTGHEYRWIEDLLRDNETDPIKVDWSAIPAGNLIKRSATGNTIADGGTIAALTYTPKEAILKDVQASGVAPQSITAATPTKIRFNTEIDPQSFVTFDDANDTFELAAGTYAFDAAVPLHESTAEPNGHVILYNETAASVLATANASSGGGGQDTTYVVLKHIVTIASATVFSLRAYVKTYTHTIGEALSLGYNETYAQLRITKLA